MKLDRRMVRASLVCVLFLFSILSLFSTVIVHESLAMTD